MLQTAVRKVIDIAVTHEYIKDDQREEYLYGLSILIDFVINDITMLMIGFLCKMLWECIVFWSAYKLLRKYCGGFHFSTSIRCYLSSCFMCSAALLCMRYVPYNLLIWSSVVVLSSILLFTISPVAAENKPLDEKETLVFGKIARIIVIGMLILYTSMTLLNILSVAKAVALSILCVTLFAVIGKVQCVILHKTV